MTYGAYANLRTPPVHVKIDAAASADLVAAPASGRRILVLALSLRLAASNTVKLQDNADADLTGAMTVTALDWPFSPAGWVRTRAGKKLNMVLGGSVQASGTLVYAEVD